MDKHATVAVGEAARMARVTIRTLHHYDAIGLLRPSMRSEGEYRLYTRDDLERLHQIRLYRELEMPLAEIGRVLDDPEFDRKSALEAHRERLKTKARSVQELIVTINRLLKGENEMSAEELFDGFQPEQHAAEAEQRWGQTDSYKVAQERTKKYGNEQMQKLQVEHAQLLQEIAKTMASGFLTDSIEAMDCAENVRLHMDKAYYPLSRAAHLELGRMYLDDARFEKIYETAAPGLTRYFVEAIEANAARS